ncbi:MAG: hypothetical protein ACT7A5_24720 [Ferrovibrionaceae bacterium]|jgi:hypothetical protein
MNVVELTRVVGRRNGRYALAAVRRAQAQRVVVRMWSWRVQP